MLSPDNRQTLAEALRPPAEFEFDSAMAVTYSLDLRAMLEVPLALAGAFGEASPEEPAAEQQDPSAGTRKKRTEPIPLLAALKQHIDNITVFAQAGQVAVPPNARRVFTFLEDSVSLVDAPAKYGVVHAKVWVLRYKPSDNSRGESHLRIVTGSRNLTRDRSWDIVARFDAVREGQEPGWARLARLDEVANLFTELLELSTRRPLGEHHRNRVESLAEAVRGSNFLLPDGVDKASVRLLGNGSKGSKQPAPFPEPEDVKRALVISPFVRKTFFERTLPNTEATLISREDELDRLGVADLQQVGRLGDVFTLNGDAVGDRGGGSADSDAGDDATGDEPASQLKELHAKAYAFDLPKGQSQLWLGSANATVSAFNRNVEVLFKLEGKTGNIGIEALMGESGKVLKKAGAGRRQGREALSFREMLVPYTPPDPDSLSDDEEDLLQTSLDRARRHVATLPVRAAVSVAGADGQHEVRFRSDKHVTLPIEGIGPDWKVTCWPQLLGPSCAQDVRLGQPLDVSFTASHEDINGWLVVCITAPDGAPETQSRQTLLPVHNIKWPEGLEEKRDTAIMREMIGDTNRFLRYLLSMLTGQPDQANAATELAEAAGLVDGSSEARRRTTSLLPALESLLKTLRTNPERLRGMTSLVKSYLRDADFEDESSLKGFEEVWDTVIALAPERTETQGGQS